MNHEASDISVVICTYTEDRWADLAAAVHSVQTQSLPPREIIVVVDHNPTLLERVRSCLPDVIVVESKEPKGLSGARNTGIAAARGKLVAFLDDDAAAAPDWLMWLNYCCEAPHILGAGGQVLPVWQDARPAWFPEEFYWVVGCSYRGMPQTTAPIRNPLGGCMCIRREVFEAVGGFRNGIGRVDSIPLGCEETELAIRARQHFPQGVFLYEPRAKAYHQIPASRGRWRYFYSRCYAEGRSKALLSRLVGAKDGLASERAYTMRTLPAGIFRGVADVFHHDFTGITRAWGIVVGLAITAAGYLSGTISERLASRRRVHAGNAAPEIRPASVDAGLPDQGTDTDTMIAERP